MRVTGMQDLKFGPDGLIPAIIQDFDTKEVLMMAYMNRQAVEKTLATGQTWFYSRSREKLWQKGETSGHFQIVKCMSFDCDADTLLVQVDQQGVACHTGARTCFHNPMTEVNLNKTNPVGAQVLGQVFAVIKDRQKNMPEGSYTTYLFEKGIDKILKKVGEEASEVIIGSKNGDLNEIRYETADLLYHLMVMLAYHGLTLEDIYQELAKRR